MWTSWICIVSDDTERRAHLLLVLHVHSGPLKPGRQSVRVLLDVLGGLGGIDRSVDRAGDLLLGHRLCLPELPCQREPKRDTAKKMRTLCSATTGSLFPPPLAISSSFMRSTALSALRMSSAPLSARSPPACTYGRSHSLTRTSSCCRAQRG